MLNFFFFQNKITCPLATTIKKRKPKHKSNKIHTGVACKKPTKHWWKELEKMETNGEILQVHGLEDSVFRYQFLTTWSMDSK